jgi:hypothetical protein
LRAVPFAEKIVPFADNISRYAKKKKKLKGVSFAVKIFADRLG